MVSLTIAFTAGSFQAAEQEERSLVENGGPNRLSRVESLRDQGDWRSEERVPDI